MKKSLEVPTLDYKGRVNLEMFDYYPNLEKNINNITYGMSYEQKQEIIEEIHKHMNAFQNRRAP